MIDAGSHKHEGRSAIGAAVCVLGMISPENGGFWNALQTVLQKSVEGLCNDREGQ